MAAIALHRTRIAAPPGSQMTVEQLCWLCCRCVQHSLIAIAIHESWFSGSVMKKHQRMQEIWKDKPSKGGTVAKSCESSHPHHQEWEHTHIGRPTLVSGSDWCFIDIEHQSCQLQSSNFGKDEVLFLSDLDGLPFLMFQFLKAFLP